jgi:hypothetical protein
MVNLPALNTPQFDWVKSRLPNKAQPVPPIFQPEVAARAIVWAADHAPRELNVGWPTTKAIVGNNLAPGVADRYLARFGYESQQTEEAEDPGRPDNLWEPVAGGHGAHGRFDARARSHNDSSAFWCLLAAAALAGMSLGTSYNRRDVHRRDRKR